MKNHVFDADGTISLLPQTKLASHQQICSMKNSGLRPGCVSAGEGLDQTLQSHSWHGETNEVRVTSAR